jgi:hypothetical protein
MPRDRPFLTNFRLADLPIIHSESLHRLQPPKPQPNKSSCDPEGYGATDSRNDGNYCNMARPQRSVLKVGSLEIRFLLLAVLNIGKLVVDASETTGTAGNRRDTALTRIDLPTCNPVRLECPSGYSFF